MAWMPRRSRCGSCRCPESQPHTAHYHGGQVTIYYPFHPRSGDQVLVIRSHRLRDAKMLVIRQPDGTLSQVPAWMCAPSAAALMVRERAQLPLTVLCSLRQILDAVLSSCSDSVGGAKDGTSTTDATGELSGADGTGTGNIALDKGNPCPAFGSTPARDDCSGTAVRLEQEGERQ